jgi:hypothetical protein
MKKTMILETLAAALFAVGQAHAAPVSLADATITATYQGSGDNILGFYGSGTDAPNVSKIDGTDQVEFMTSDALFAFDFSATGLVSIYANMQPDPAANYTFTFDFGNTLPAPLTGFTLGAHGVLDNLPGLAIGSDQHSISIDLSQLTWNDLDYTPVTAQLSSAPAPSNVPEPASLALVLAGAAGLLGGGRKRRTTSRA